MQGIGHVARSRHGEITELERSMASGPKIKGKSVKKFELEVNGRFVSEFDMEKSPTPEYVREIKARPMHCSSEHKCSPVFGIYGMRGVGKGRTTTIKAIQVLRHDIYCKLVVKTDMYVLMT
ncbi:uncharacterized protein LOC110006909 isoform X1 [Amborella trichopoda]|uniref:Uncharacterized protein n=1 Tax=Amborella trichopoda TaxID=13333 RepID=W1NX62_AMBTC|nr:uncharacterized protein LOC110006909 isoform X1 [Amborella trichopoda]ERN02192.1 hypothetical protein AMTR_s00045p00205130 [Amborella trichopoda]|eukprot:XP_020520620.1 uncharacterized protein LOC110006909 isoform X1 [Amborella trichopoda]